jgi:hypothetical protein
MSSNPNVDLTDVITDAVNDAAIPDDPISETEIVPEPIPQTEVEIPGPEPVVESTDAPTSDADATVSPESTSTAISSPAANKTQTEADKLDGIQQMGINGRENRIPYSRVKKITENAVNGAVSEIAETVLGRKLNTGEKAVDAVKAYVARLPELETKVTDYEARLEKVGQVEDIMINDAPRFLQMLRGVPQYKEFFDFVEQAYAQQSGQAPAQQPAAQPVGHTAAGVAPEGMPEPDEELSDGSKVYSLQGLQRLLDWKAAQVEQQVEQKISKQFEERYAPMHADWNERRRVEAAMPVIRKKLEEAHTWPLFTENQDEITEYMAKNPQASLELSYQSVVFPKLLSTRTQARQEVIKDMQKAPTSTSVPVRAATKPNPPSANPNRTLEDVIRESVSTLK